MRDQKLNTMIKISLLSVIAFLLQYVDFPLPVFPSFLKIDISDFPALLGGFALGPVAGVLIELFKNILHGIFKSQTAWIGEFANFSVGAVFVFVSAIVYQKNKNLKNALLGLVAGTLVMSLFASVLNYYVLLPLYEKILHFPVNAVVGMGKKINPSIKDLRSFVVLSILPFNLLKGVFVSALTAATYKSLSPILKSEHKSVFAKNR